MEYTLENLINILRRRLQDEEYDSENLRIFLNDSQNEILGEDKYPFMQQIDTYLADERGEVSLPINYAGTYAIYAKQKDQPRRPLKYISPEAYFNATSEHQMVYTVFANTLFYRARKSDQDDDVEIVHLYLQNPRPLIKATDKTVLPAQYVEALILGAMARAEETRDNFDFAQIYRNQQDQILTNMKLRYGPGNLTAENRSRLPYFGGACDGRI